MINEYPPYSLVEDSVLQQGDLVEHCLVVVPVSLLEDIGNAFDDETKYVDGEVVKYNVIILSQSCDLEPRGENSRVDLEYVLVCPVWPLSRFAAKGGIYKSKKGREQLRRGLLPAFHLLHKCEIDGYERDCLYVDFRQVHSVPYDTVQYCIAKEGKRLRLLPPYREHLSQAFARFFMRVGLPLPIPPFNKSI